MSYYFLWNAGCSSYIKIERPSIQLIGARKKSEFPVLFGIKFIDFLESIPDCKKDITVNMDSGGWCYIKGEYNYKQAFRGYYLIAILD
jgi:hypothetical protein